MAPGKITLTLSGERLTPLQTEETVTAGEELDVTYKVALAPPPGAQQGPSDDFEILVTAPPPLKKEVASTKVAAEQARSVPGAQGDVLKVVENLPGVARPPVGTGSLVVWGSGPGDSRTYVDGVPIPVLYHQGGVRSTIYSSVVTSVELVPGGYGAAYGRGLGGIVRVDTKTPDKQGLHGRVATDVLDASAMLSSNIGEKTHTAAAARVSLIDQFSKFLNEDVNEFAPIPRYRDAQLRLRRDLGQGKYVDFVGLMSMDHAVRGVPNSDPALVTQETRDIDWYRAYAHYVSEGGNGTRTVVTPYFGYTKASDTASYGSSVTSLATQSWLAGLRASHDMHVARWFNLQGGIDAEVATHQVTRSGSVGLPPREGDVRVFGQPPPDSINTDKFYATYVGLAPYVEGDIMPMGDKLHIIPGLRLDPLFRSVSRKLPPQGDNPDIGLFALNFSVEPRLAVRWATTKWLTLNTAVGLYHQQPTPADLSATFGNPALVASKGWHVVGGAAMQLMDKLLLELTGFATFLDALTMRNNAEQPLAAEALLNTGKGRAMGIQTMLRRELANHVFGWVAYTLMRSQRQNDESSAWRLFDYDQTHVLSSVLVWNPFKGFEVGGRFRVVSGYPRTAVVSTYYDASRDRTQPIFGNQNGIRLPLFMQLDLRVSQAWQLGTSELMAYLEVQNITNRDNTEDFAYSPDFTEQGKIQSLPILPVAGLQWIF